MAVKSCLDADIGDNLALRRKSMAGRAFGKISRLSILARSLYLPPSWVQVEPTTKCNLRCTICLRTHTCPSMSDDMSMDVFKLIIDQSASSRLVKPVLKLIGLGEPLLNPHIGSMVEYAKKKGLYVDVVSNFTLGNPKIFEKFIEAQLDSLCVSLDAASPEVFERIRVGAKFDEVINNVKLFLGIRKSMNSVKPRVIFRSTINEDNAAEIPAIVELARSINIDGVGFTNQIVSGKENCEYPHLATPSFGKSQGKNRRLFMEANLCCPAMRRCYITFDGKVMPCNFLMEIIPRNEYPRFEFGDVTQDSLHSIWFSKRYKQFRVGKASGVHPYFCNSCPCLLGMN